jgi:hypothetical protein
MQKCEGKSDRFLYCCGSEDFCNAGTQIKELLYEDFTACQFFFSSARNVAYPSEKWGGSGKTYSGNSL